MARLGASSGAHAIDAAIGATAHAVGAPRPEVAAPSLSPEARAQAAAPLATTVRSSGHEGLATEVRDAELGSVAPRARRARPGIGVDTRLSGPLRSEAHRRDPVARPRARAAAGGGVAYGLRTVRRARVPWQELGRERLATAWGRVQTEHGGSGELLLVGVFGPVPLEALESVALEPDGRLAMTFGRRGLLGRRGDVALARVVATDRLVRCDVPHTSDG